MFEFIFSGDWSSSLISRTCVLQNCSHIVVCIRIDGIFRVFRAVCVPRRDICIVNSYYMPIHLTHLVVKGL